MQKPGSTAEYHARLTRGAIRVREQCEEDCLRLAAAQLVECASPEQLALAEHWSNQAARHRTRIRELEQSQPPVAETQQPALATSEGQIESLKRRSLRAFK